MDIKQVSLEDLQPVDTFRLSYPLRPDLYNELSQQLAPLPLLIINQNREIIFGIDYYHYLRSPETRDTVKAQAIIVETSLAESLVLNFNLKTKYTGVNPYEKLAFIKKITPLLLHRDIYHKTGLDISIDRHLTGKLDMLLAEEFKEVFINDLIAVKCGLKLCDFPPADRGTLLSLFSRAAFSNSHQLRIMEMAEEITFRDKCPLSEIFERLGIDTYLENEKPQKSIVDAIFRCRNPVYSESEEKWQKEIKHLKLPPNMQVTHYPFFEKKQLNLSINLPDAEALKSFLERLSKD